MSDLKDVGIMLLAAGGSTRMGKPKLAQIIQGKTILERVLSMISELDECQKVIVLGASYELYEDSIPQQKIHVLVNTNWSSGIASSIRVGMEYFYRQPARIDRVMILLADMIMVRQDWVSSLISASFRSNKGIIACEYGGSYGPPVIFKDPYFEDLMKLRGDTGAKKIIMRNPGDVEALPYPEGIFDIDTPDDLLKNYRLE